MTSVRVRALSGNQILVYATPADQLDIIEYINGYGKANKEITKTLSAGSMDLTDAVTLLKAMFPLPDKGGPFIDKHPNGNGIVVRGKPEQIADIEAVLGKGMGSSGTSDTSHGSPTTSGSSTSRMAAPPTWPRRSSSSWRGWGLRRPR